MSSKNINQFPYFTPKVLKEDKIKFKESYSYLKNSFSPYFKKVLKGQKHLKLTRFLNPKPKDFVETIRNFKTIKKYGKQPNYIYFDIKKFYPSIDQKILREKIIQIYLQKRIFEKRKNLYKKNGEIYFTRGFKKFLENLEIFFNYCPIYGRGILTGTSLGGILAEFYLWDFFQNLNTNVFRWNDDFLILDRNLEKLKGTFLDSKKYFQEIDLQINTEKLKEGKLFNDEFSFIGFYFYGTKFVGINSQKLEEFFQKISNIFSLKKLNFQNLEFKIEKIKGKIKKLRNLQFGFYNYYKICDYINQWKKINGKVRKIIRDYFFKFYPKINLGFFVRNKFLDKIGVLSF